MQTQKYLPRNSTKERNSTNATIKQKKIKKAGALPECSRVKHCLEDFKLKDIEALRRDHINKTKKQKLTWLVEQLRTMDVPIHQKHFNYTIRGESICRNCFMYIHDLTQHMLDKAKSIGTNGRGSIQVHGNCLPQVQGQRAQMTSAIQGIIYADLIMTDEEKVQTGATFVNMTFEHVVQLSHEKITEMWMNDELPETPEDEVAPTLELVRKALKNLRNQFGTDIVYANDSNKWYCPLSFLVCDNIAHAWFNFLLRFICKKCFDFAERRREGFSSNSEEMAFRKECDLHTTEHRTARTHMDANARFTQQHPSQFSMIILDGTPGPTFPCWPRSAKPDNMKGRYCLPLYWEIGKSYGNNQWYYFLSPHWWPKGANYLLEIKYHLLRSLFTSHKPHALATTLLDQFDGGSENRNFPNFSFLSELVSKGILLIFLSSLPCFLFTHLFNMLTLHHPC